MNGEDLASLPLTHQRTQTPMVAPAPQGAAAARMPSGCSSVAAAVDPPLITLEEIDRDEVEIQVDLEKWDSMALDHRNLLWHEVGRIQNDTIPRTVGDGCPRYGLGGAIGELWVQDGLLLLMALLSGFAGYRLYLKNNSEKRPQDAITADERAIDLACRLATAFRTLTAAWAVR